MRDENYTNGRVETKYILIHIPSPFVYQSGSTPIANANELISKIDCIRTLQISRFSYIQQYKKNVKSVIFSTSYKIRKVRDKLIRVSTHVMM